MNEGVEGHSFSCSRLLHLVVGFVTVGQSRAVSLFPVLVPSYAITTSKL